MKRALPLVVMLMAHAVCAQNAANVAAGQSFANSIAPSSPSQIVNPSGVNGSAWGGQTGTPTSVPTGLGGFSSPNTSSTLLNTAKSSSLTQMGNQAMTDCANYVPGSDPYQNQYCAAVNFLNNQCLQPTTGEKSILGNTGTTQGSTSNCAGTYGAGQSKFGYADQETSTDNIFGPISNLGTNAAGVMQQTCKSQAVVTQPAQYANNTCIVSRDAESDGCTQQLNVNASSANTPATLGQVGCVSPWITLYSGSGKVMGCLIAAADSLNLQTGDTYDGLIIFHKDFVDSFGHVDKDGWDGFDHEWGDWEDSFSGGTLAHCTGANTPLNCFKEVFATAGFNHNTDTGIATEWYSYGQGYVCPTGATLSGSNCVAKTFNYNWTDNCGPLTGGAALPPPSQ